MEKMNSVNGKTYIETLKVFWTNRWLLSFLFIFSSDFFFDGIFYLTYLSYFVFEFFLRSDQTEDEEEDEEDDDDHKEVKKILTDMEQKIRSDLQSLRTECGEIREELNIRGKMMMTRMDNMEQMICSQLGCLTDNLRLNVDENWNELRHELISKIAGDTNLNFQINQSKRVLIRGEDVEKVSDMREKVRRLSMEAEIVAEELSSATANLVEAMIQHWEENNADYLASLPFLYRKHY